MRKRYKELGEAVRAASRLRVRKVGVRRFPQVVLKVVLSSSKTRETHTHVSNRSLGKIVGPLDWAMEQIKSR